MISIGNRATSKIVGVLSAPTGLNTNIAALAQAENVSLAPISDQHVFTDNVTIDLAEKAGEAKYTAIYVYCDKITNSLKEKFRSFSGSIQLTVEIRTSQDRLEGIDRKSQLYTDAVAQVLNENRGDWGQGLFYSGGYEVAFGAVKHGGRNFVKSNKITLLVDASID